MKSEEWRLKHLKDILIKSLRSKLTMDEYLRKLEVRDFIMSNSYFEFTVNDSDNKELLFKVKTEKDSHGKPILLYTKSDKITYLDKRVIFDDPELDFAVLTSSGLGRATTYITDEIVSTIKERQKDDDKDKLEKLKKRRLKTLFGMVNSRLIMYFGSAAETEKVIKFDKITRCHNYYFNIRIRSERFGKDVVFSVFYNFYDNHPTFLNFSRDIAGEGTFSFTYHINNDDVIEVEPGVIIDASEVIANEIIKIAKENDAIALKKMSQFIKDNSVYGLLAKTEDDCKIEFVFDAGVKEENKMNNKEPRKLIDNAFNAKWIPRIENVIFKNPATIIVWADGTKTIVKCQEDIYDPEKGLSIALCKKLLGNKYDYYNLFKHFLKNAPEPEPVKKKVKKQPKKAGRYKKTTSN